MSSWKTSWDRAFSLGQHFPRSLGEVYNSESKHPSLHPPGSKALTPSVNDKYFHRCSGHSLPRLTVHKKLVNMPHDHRSEQRWLQTARTKDGKLIVYHRPEVDHWVPLKLQLHKQDVKTVALLCCLLVWLQWSMRGGWDRTSWMSQRSLGAPYIRGSLP